MPTPSHPPLLSSRDRFGWRIISLLTIVALLGFNIPWRAEIAVDDDLDASWILVLHHAVAHGWHWGHDIVWHYGPFGFLYGGYYHPDTYYQLLLFRGLLNMIAALGILRLALHTAINPVMPLAAAFIITSASDVFFLTFPLLLWLHYLFIDTKLRSPLFWLLLGCCSLVSLVKISYLLTAVAMLGALTLHRLMARLPLALLPVSLYSVITIGIWLIAGQPLTTFDDFIHYALELGSGFTTMAGYERSPFFLLLFMAILLSWIAVMVAAISHQASHDSIIILCGGIGWLLILIKLGFVQDNDHHVLQAIACLLLLIILSKDLVWPYCQSRLAKSAFIASLGGLLLVAANDALHSPDEWQQILALFEPSADIISDKVASAHTSLSTEKRYQAWQAALRANHPLNPSGHHGTADLISYNQSVLLAHPAFDYSPRPVFQSYHAYTPALASLNQAHLEQADAPDHLFMTSSPMRGRYPTLDDAALYPLLFSHYHIVDILPGYLHWQRRDTSLPLSPTLQEARRTRLNTPITMPEAAAHSIIWAEIEMQPSTWHALLSLVFRPPPVWIDVTLASGYQRRDRFIPAIAGEGWLLSPLIDNHLQLAALTNQHQQAIISNNRLSTFQITTKEQTSAGLPLWNPEITVHFYQLPVPAIQADWPRLEALMPYLNLSLAPGPGPVSPPRYMIDQHIAIDNAAQGTAITIRDDAHLRHQWPVQCNSLSLQIGRFSFRPEERQTQAPVRFTVRGMMADGSQTSLYSQEIAAENMTPQSVTITPDLMPRAIDIMVDPHAETGLGQSWMYLHQVKWSPENCDKHGLIMPYNTPG